LKENPVKLQRCVRCGGTSFKAAKKRLARNLDGRDFETEIPALQCKTCGEQYFAATDGVRFELAVARRLAELGAASAEAFRFMRKTIGMQAGELAMLLGVARETVSRWETGKRNVDRGAAIALGSLVLDRDATLKRLRALQKPPRKGPIHVDLSE
jgi:putative transcriptional regulator